MMPLAPLVALVLAASGDLSAARLERDIYKVDQSIDQTEVLLSRARGTAYEPELKFRLCELYVEKSRLVYHLQAARRPEGEKGAVVSPETRLLKEKAVDMYDRLLREFPEYKDNDKVRFYLAHELRELGQFDEMLKRLGELIKKHPRSVLRLEAEQIIGDHFFDKADLVEAENHYREILKAKESPVHDLARYKMGWVRVNQGKHAEAVRFFEAAVKSQPVAGVDPNKSLNVKREALLDLVYSYTEARSGKRSVKYFERLSDSRTTFALALDKLSSRYIVKQQPEYAVPALRKLLDVRPDHELDLERAQSLYDQLKLGKTKVVPNALDIRYLVRAATRVRVDMKKPPAESTKLLAELEEMSRDLATQLHLTAQKKDKPELYAEAANAYKEYLTLFRKAPQVIDVMKNRADALYASNQYPEASRQFEELAALTDGSDAKTNELAMYGALLSHKASLEEREKRTGFQRMDSRQAIKLMGATFISRYPRNEHVADVRFNIARAHFDDGDLKKAAELFTAFAVAHPSHKDAPAAGHLAMDSYRQLKDFGAIERTGMKLLAANLPESFRNQTMKVMKQIKGEELRELALESAAKTGDVVAGLVKIADERGGAIGAKALVGAMQAAHEKGDFGQEKELALRVLAQNPKSPEAKAIPITLARRSAEAARFPEAAEWFEKSAAQADKPAAAAEALRSAGNLYLALGDLPRGIRALEQAAAMNESKRTELLTTIAETLFKAGDTKRAEAAARKLLSVDNDNTVAAMILAETTQGQEGELEEILAAGEGDAAARGLWRMAERQLAAFQALPATDLEGRLSALPRLEATYTRIAGMGSREWTVASLWRLGVTYSDMAQAVANTPPPAELTGADAEAFRQAVRERATPLKDRAKEAFGNCLKSAASFDVFSPAVLGCRQQTAQAPSILPPTPPRRAAPVPEMLQKEVDRSASAKNLLALGLAYLEQQQVGMARLTLARAIEVDDTVSQAHSALGWALLQQGDADAASAAYRKALEMGPNNDRAHANLSALKCRVGDRAGARETRAQIKDMSQVNGPDVDPAWRSCVDAISKR